MPGFSDTNPLFTLATVLVVGVLFGAVATRLRMPGITGQIIAGVVLGQAGLAVFDQEAIHGLQPLTRFAFGLMAVTVGAHLNVHRLYNAGKRLFFLLLFESLLTPLVVFAGLYFATDLGWSYALLLATLAISTAPATIIAVVQEARAKGVFVKTLIAAVALNNMSCILLFELARAAAKVEFAGGTVGFDALVMAPLEQLFLALVIGGGAAAAMELITRWWGHAEKRATAAFIILLLTLGSAEMVDCSPPLACLILGLCQANFAQAREKILDTVFSDFQPTIFAIFFTLAGMELSFEHINEVGIIALIFLATRAIGKVLAANWAMRLAGATQRVRQYLGLALIPQAGLAVGLTLLLQEDAVFRESHPHMLSIFVGVVLSAVTVNEILGPVLTRTALGRAGEVGKDRMRLIDFIQEEHIVTDLEARTKDEAIEALTGLLVRSHKLRAEDARSVYESVLAREAQVSTCLGGGLAVPHGILPNGSQMVGVMGLSRAGLAFDTPDDKPVHCMVLLATPESERDRHLQVLASLARTFGTDPVMQAQLFNAQSPAHASEILHDEEAEGFNYFLED